MQKSKKIILFDIDNTLFNTLKFKESNSQMFSLYEEVYGVLEELSKVAYLGIFSEGDIVFQKNKLKQTNIEKYFLEEHTHIVSKKAEAIEQLIKKYKDHNQVYLVDDKLTILPIIKKDFPSVFTIWIKRGEYAPFQQPIENFSPDAEIEKLEEVILLITEDLHA